MNKKIFFSFLFIIILTAILDVFIDRNSANRILVLIIQLGGVILGFIAFISYLKQKNVLVFNSWLTSFIILITFYAIFSNNFISQYPRVLYSVLPFYIFYNVAKSGVVIEKSLQIFSIIMVLVSVYQLYVGYFVRMEDISGDFLNRADNVAYQLLSVMVVISVLKPKLIHLILISTVYLAILISLKRGAMISSTILFIFYFLQFKKSHKKSSKFISILGSTIFLIGIPLIIRKYSEILLYRFIIDESGGSGREAMYTSIFNDWLSFPFINQIIGGGFFSLFDGLGYAHSDWFQILYDHGVLGIIIFIGIHISLFNFRKKIKIFNQKYYFPFLGIYFVVFFKSIFSGTYMTKFDAMTYGAIGLIMGITYHRQKQTIIKARTKRDEEN